MSANQMHTDIFNLPLVYITLLILMVILHFNQTKLINKIK